MSATPVQPVQVIVAAPYHTTPAVRSLLLLRTPIASHRGAPTAPSTTHTRRCSSPTSTTCHTPRSPSASWSWSSACCERPAPAPRSRRPTTTRGSSPRCASPTPTAATLTRRATPPLGPANPWNPNVAVSEAAAAGGQGGLIWLAGAAKCLQFVHPLGILLNRR
jgi:hypothetical protein